jgi:hypothetical protein
MNMMAVGMAGIFEDLGVQLQRMHGGGGGGLSGYRRSPVHASARRRGFALSLYVLKGFLAPALVAPRCPSDPLLRRRRLVASWGNLIRSKGAGWA